ncbi:FAD:protein FMN transferase [Vibrio aerogenes]|uniref:FAD:protein FMN transferase n=1 Tax=Vibrio aerogenes TaxID=92172 RepID=UPI0009369E3D|nr:FAD:protein FMN transferase [Vibrio aerogenes]
MRTTLLILSLSALLSGCERSPELVHIHGSTMGTSYNIKYLADDRAKLAPEELKSGIDGLLETVNDQMSTYRKKSELSRFNQYQGTDPVLVSPQLYTVVKEAMRLNQVTQGALDVTVGPLVNLWGFGPEGRPEVVPSENELASLRKRVGVHHLHLTEQGIQKDIPALYVDLSSIAKGWGVDVISDYLISLNVNNFMVEIGGEIRTRGQKLNGHPWRIAIEKPAVDQHSVQEIIEPGNMGIATSGDYRNYFEQDGIRYSHIIDPVTEKPITNKVVSVTVIDKSTMTADGLATGFMVLGHEKSIKIAERYDIPVLIIVKTENGFTEVSSSAFKPYLKH